MMLHDGGRFARQGHARPVHRARDLTGVVLALLAIALYYNWYRYPFRINSTDTSPTYADTPLWLSLGKYLLVALVLAAAVGARSLDRERVRLLRPLEALAYAYLAAVPIVAGIAVAEPDIAQIGVFFLVPLVLLPFGGWRVEPARINRLVRATVYVAIGVQLLQVALFLTVGRLPALAYTDTVSIRFGSFLDDPNGFGILVAWMLPFTWAYFGWVRSAVLTALLLLSLVLTQSLTAIAVTGVVSAISLAWWATRGGRPLLLTVTATAGLLVAGGALVYRFLDPLSQTWAVFMLSKQGSIVGHAESLEIVRSLRAMSLAGVEPAADSWGESGYANFLAFFGFAYPILYVAVIGRGAAAYFRMFSSPAADRELRAFSAAGLGFLLAVLLANINLPVAEIYPLNLMAALLVALPSAGIVLGCPERRATAVAALRPDRALSTAG